ncbi:MAG: cyclic nucleotide-binding domain-containing protein [Geminicoccaceae bacterium]
MEGLERIVLAHPFFAGLDPKLGEAITGCVRNHRFDPGQYLFHEGDPANEFFLIRHGSVALEILPPGQKAVVISTEPAGSIVGTSWLAAPYQWRFDARARELTRAIGVDAKCLRGKCEADNHLGYEMMKRFLPLVAGRLDDTRMQLLDVYGRRSA